MHIYIHAYLSTLYHDVILMAVVIENNAVGKKEFITLENDCISKIFRVYKKTSKCDSINL